MSESWSGKAAEIKSRLKEAASGPDGKIDAESVIRNLRAAGNDVDAEALGARVREVVGTVEGKIDAEKLKQWADEVDAGKLQGWLAEGKTMAAGAAAMAATQGERLAERAPGAVDKLVGTAKEVLGDMLGNEDLAHEGELEQLRGQIKEKYADSGE